MPSLSRRTASFTDSVIRRMTRVAQAHNAINLAQGFPDFPPPPELTKALARMAADGPHQYAVTWGAANFRKALAERQSGFTGFSIDPDREVTVTCGSTEAMMAAVLAVADPGDKVIVFSPFYENYGADAILSGAEPIWVELHGRNFDIDPDELATAFAQKPKAIIVCNPSNPSGKVFTRAELELIGKLATQADAWIITDEVYEHIVYAPNVHTYVAALPGLRERTISCSSLSKTFAITGWRLGYVIAPPSITDVIRKVHDFLTVGAAAPLQEAALAGFALPDSYFKGLSTSYLGHRERFCGWLDKAGLSYVKPQGAYYVLVDVSAWKVDDDVAFSEWMTRVVGVAPVPGSSFFRNRNTNWVRFHFAKRDETLDAAGERLLRLPELAESWKA